VYEPVYLAGIVAWKTTKSNKLGYVYAFPISQTLDNINAFELGAKSVNPQAKTYVVKTSSWGHTGKQDRPATVIRATEAAGAYTVGYHADASSLAPKGWLTGSQWNWDPLYVKIVKKRITRNV